MTAFAIDYKKNTIRAFKSKRSALNMGNGLVVFTSVDELLENKNTTNQGIVAVYNNNTDVAVKRFSDTRTGAARLLKLAQDIHVESTPFDEAPKKTPQVAPLEGMTPLGITPKSAPFSRENMGMDVAKIVKDDAKKPRGAFAGKKIKCLVDVNPRKEGTRGWNNFSLFLGHGTISYEDFVELAAGHGSTKGGCREDLAHDIKKGRVELV